MRTWQEKSAAPGRTAHAVERTSNASSPRLKRLVAPEGVDGQSITVPLAEPLKDANGNVVQDMEGKTTPRYTTIYDAATKLYGDEAKIPIPTLCHLPHMTPVAVCRLCVVQITDRSAANARPNASFYPPVSTP